MIKYNFLSEGNSIINYDIERENEKENYYEKRVEDINYCYSQISKKNKQIIEYKNIIANLQSTQEKLLQDIQTLHKKTSNSNINKPKNKMSEIKKEFSQEQILLSKIKKLQNENTKLKMRINKSEEKENIFYANINNKLLKAERDIELLSFENKNNNNIILAIQNFLFNINEKLNSENQTLIFDLSLIDNNTFIHNLQILESNIINKINQLNNIGNICLYNSRNYDKRKLYDFEGDTYIKNHYTIGVGRTSDTKIKNIKKILKHRNQMKPMKTINYINSQNIKKKKFGLFYNNYFTEKQKDFKPMKAYSLRNDYLKDIGINDDICFENKENKINNMGNNGRTNDTKQK